MSQLDKCLKFKSIRGDKNDYTLHKVTPHNATNFRNLFSCDTIVSDLTKIPFPKRLIGISCLKVEVLNDQNLFTESNLANWFSSYVQFCSGGQFPERAEAAR